MNALISTHRTRFTENFKRQLSKATKKDLTFLPAAYLKLLRFQPSPEQSIGNGIYELEVMEKKLYLFLTKKSLVPLCIGRRKLNNSLKKTIEELSKVISSEV